MDDKPGNDLMLDVPFSKEDRTFDGLGLSEGEAPLYSYAWHPRLVLLPTWQLDFKARLVKRLVDLGLTLSALIVFAIPALLLMLAIRLESPGPALYRQQRIGRFGRQFTALKFRSMVCDPSANGMSHQTTRNDPRVTRIGRWTRRYSVDELPQLINVLR